MELFIIDNEFRSLYNIDVFESFFGLNGTMGMETSSFIRRSATL